ncbi:MAG TPA: DUF2336 domain-containing protein [Pseudolabrys sp.]|nr:DUF2336 domain-containing protein [Pseudolabrys sp.]
MAKSSQLPPIDGLLDLACRDGVDIRPTLLRVVTDLYVQKASHTAEEERQYVELATGLVDAVDTATREIVTATLRAYAAAPAAVLHKLTGEAPAPVKPPAAAAARDELTEMFMTARPDERRLILANLVPDARPMRRASPETLADLERAALQRDQTAFSRTLAAALGVAPALAERITRDTSGEPLVVAAKALGMSAAVVQRVLLFLNPVIGQSIARVYDLAQLFDEVTPEAAAQMAAIWRAPLARKKPAHEAVHYDDERRPARSFGHAARPARTGRITGPTRKADRAG